MDAFTKFDPTHVRRGPTPAWTCTYWVQKERDHQWHGRVPGTEIHEVAPTRDECLDRTQRACDAFVAAGPDFAVHVCGELEYDPSGQRIV